MKEYLNLLNKGNIEEAYKGFKELYEKNHNIVALYYLTMIDFEFKRVPMGELCNNFKILYEKGNYNIKNAIVGIYISVLFFELEDYSTCLSVCEKERKRNKLDPLANLAYSYCLFKKDQNNADRSLELLNDSLVADENFQFIKLLVYELMIKIYISKKDVFSAKQILGKLTLLSPKENRLHFLNLLINFAEGNKELDQDSIDIIIKTDHVSDFVDALYEYCSETQDLQWCIDTLTPYTNKSVYNYLLQRRIALCHLELGRYKETIAYLEELISKDENIDVSDAYFIMAEAYLFIGKKDSLLKAMEYCQESIKLEPHVHKYRSLGLIAKRLRDKELLLKTIECFKEKYPNEKYRLILEAYYYRIEKRFDLAMEAIAPIAKGNKYLPEISEIITACSKKVKPAIKYYAKELKKGNKFLQFVANYYGDYGYKINTSDELINELDEVKTKDSCDLSLLALYLLDKNPKKAISHLAIGIRRYENDLDACPCCIGVYAKCLLEGIGVDKNVNKAYKLTLAAIEKSGGNITDNVLTTFAEACMLLNKDVEKAYQYLIDYQDKKYNPNWLFTMIKLCDVLGVDSSTYKKDFKVAIKQSSIREKEYYSKHPNTTMITNF